jgi:hypothetical protein
MAAGFVRTPTGLVAKVAKIAVRVFALALVLVDVALTLAQARIV